MKFSYFITGLFLFFSVSIFSQNIQTIESDVNSSRIIDVSKKEIKKIHENHLTPDSLVFYNSSNSITRGLNRASNNDEERLDGLIEYNILKRPNSAKVIDSLQIREKKRLISEKIIQRPERNSVNSYIPKD